MVTPLSTVQNAANDVQCAHFVIKNDVPHDSFVQSCRVKALNCDAGTVEGAVSQHVAEPVPDDGDDAHAEIQPKRCS